MSSVPSETFTRTLKALYRHRSVLAEYMAVDNGQLAAVVDELLRAKKEKLPVYVAGNGGSAANASHMVLHLRQAGILAVDLGHGPLMSAISNDEEYKNSFAGQVGHQGVTLVFSCSGNSPNILELLRRSNGSKIGFLGFNGGKALGMVTHPVLVTGTDYGILEDAHSALIHIVVDSIGVNYR